MILWLYDVRIHCIILYYIISQSITLSHIALYCITLYYMYIALYYIIVNYIIVYYFIVVYYFRVVYYIIVYYCISHYIIYHMILSCIYIGTYMYICHSYVYLTIYRLWLRKIEEHCVILWCRCSWKMCLSFRLSKARLSWESALERFYDAAQACPFFPASFGLLSGFHF